jgi:hypothetical protein
MKKDPKPQNKRMIHIWLTEEVHRKLRIRAAELDISIQEFVQTVIERELSKQEK